MKDNILAILLGLVIIAFFSILVFFFPIVLAVILFFVSIAAILTLAWLIGFIILDR